MRFHALLPVRDEADIIAQCLGHLLQWADAVYVFDTGSVDETYHIIQELAGKDDRIKLLGADPVFFSETRLRGWMFNQAREQFEDGDWFLRVDADEFHHLTPPEFVETRMKAHETCAYHQYYDFCLLESEVESWNHNCVAEESQPIEQRRRWYIPSVYSEPRLCRYRGTMQWPPTVSFPFNAGYVARNRLPIRHYPHRDPQQLSRRCRLRAVMMADSENSRNWSRPQEHHWARNEWRKFVVPDSDARLRYWAPGTDLPEFDFSNHLAPSHIRMLQQVAHRFMLPILDRGRPHWPPGAYPQRIPQELNALLQRELSGGD
jgi:glycosyltransferase involved in cell wall biosynthesis